MRSMVLMAISVPTGRCDALRLQQARGGGRTEAKRKGWYERDQAELAKQ